MERLREALVELHWEQPSEKWWRSERRRLCNTLLIQTMIASTAHTVNRQASAEVEDRAEAQLSAVDNATFVVRGWLLRSPEAWLRRCCVIGKCLLFMFRP